MKVIEIEFAGPEENPILLMSREERAAKQGQRDALRESAAQLAALPTPEIVEGEVASTELPASAVAASQLEVMAAGIEAEIAGDDLLRAAHAPRTAVFKVRDPKLADRVAVQQRLVGIEDPTLRNAVAMVASLEVMVPEVVSGVSGAVEELALPFQEAVAKACDRYLYPSIGEDRARFLTASRNGSS